MDKEQLLYHYFSNELTPEQQQQFNELLKTDSEFKAQFDFEKDLQKAIRDSEAKGLKAKLVGFEKDLAQETQMRTLRPNYSKFAMAASVALLVTIGWLAYNYSGTNFGKLYDSNFQQYPNTVYTITRGDTIESLERKAFSAYETGDYDTAIDYFEKIPVNERKEYHDFYSALSHMNLKRDKEAQQLFKKVIASKSEFAAEATWYLALVSIRKEDKNQAIQYLNELTSKFDYNKSKALELLQELE